MFLFYMFMALKMFVVRTIIKFISANKFLPKMTLSFDCDGKKGCSVFYFSSIGHESDTRYDISKSVFESERFGSRGFPTYNL